LKVPFNAQLSAMLFRRKIGLKRLLGLEEK